MQKFLSIISTALFCVSALPALAASSSDDHHREGARHHRPPEEAIAACKGLSAKDICQFNGRNNELVSGVCDTRRAAKTDETSSLVCRPKRDDKDRPATEDKPNH